MAHVHLVNSLHFAYGGSEIHAVTLFEEIAKYGDVSLWTEYLPDPMFVGAFPIRGIEEQRGIFPKGGALVFIGVFFGIGNWVQHANPDRVVVIFNTPDWDRLEPLVERLRSATGRSIEVVYHSDEQRDRFPQYPGPLQNLLIDCSHFRPKTEFNENMVVGRLSRDDPEKYHDEDPALYERIADLGCKVRIQGGTILSDRIDHPRAELLPVGTIPSDEFLRSLDCFIYRINANWFEAWGRVVAEAMATGLPVVAENREDIRNSSSTERPAFSTKHPTKRLATFGSSMRILS